MTNLSAFWTWLNIEESKLNEIQRGQKEGFPKIDQTKRINSYAKFGYLAHFGDLGEQGRFSMDRYVKQHEFGWGTPVGVYGYPIDKMEYQVATRTVPFPPDAHKKPLYILRVYRPEKLLVLSDAFNIDAFVKQLKRFVDPVKVDRAAQLYRSEPTKFPVYITNNLTKSPYQWTKLLEKMGYVGIYDPGFGAIHTNEPTQVVVFGPQYFEIVEVFRPKMDIKNQPKKALKLIQTGDLNTQLNIASEIGLPPEILQALAASPHPQVRNAVAKKHNLPQDILIKLANDNSIDVLESVAENSSTPSEALMILLQNGVDKNLKALVAFHLNATSDILDFLSTDESYSVRRAVTENPKTSSATLEKMIVPNNQSLFPYIEENPNVTNNILIKIIKMADRFMRAQLASRYVDPQMLNMLSTDQDATVRLRVANNPGTSLEVLQRLAADSNEKVVVAAKKNLKDNF